MGRKSKYSPHQNGLCMGQVAEKYKQTDIGLIPSDWEAISIERVCKLINGRGFKPYEWKEQGLPIIRIQNLNGSDEFNYYAGSYNKKIEIEKGQLLFAWSGNRGTSFGPYIWNGEKGVLNYHTWKVVVDEFAIDKYYFLHALKKLTKYIEEQAHGASALVHVQKWEMEKFSFPLPPTKTEQVAIATALSDADRNIGSLEKLIAKKRLIKQGSMQKLLQPKEGWEVKKLGEIFNITAGGDLRKECFSLIKDDIFQYPIYSNALTNKGLYGYSSEYVCNENTITVTARGEVGNANPRYSKYTAIGRVLVLNPKVEVDCYFISECINSFVDFANESTGVPQLTAPQISNYEIIIPDYDEQNRIANILSDMDNEIQSLGKQLVKAKLIKQGMMQQLLTGKIRLI